MMTTESTCIIPFKAPKIAWKLNTYPIGELSLFRRFWGLILKAGMEMLEELGRSWPSFLGDLDSNPEKAKRTFLDLGYRYLVARPPKAFFWFSQDERLDLASDVLLHLIDDGFLRLRKYRDQGTSFLGWLRISANNYAKDVWKKRKMVHNKVTPINDDFTLPDYPNNPTRSFDKKDIDRVRAIIYSMENRLCLRVLVWRLLYEFTNKEMTIKLGWTPDRNGEVGNIFRTCRMALIDRLKATGIDSGILEA